MVCTCADDSTGIRTNGRRERFRPKMLESRLSPVRFRVNPQKRLDSSRKNAQFPNPKYFESENDRSLGVILRLSVPEFAIFSGGVHKFIVTALLDDPAFVENDYLIAEPAA